MGALDPSLWYLLKEYIGYLPSLLRTNVKKKSKEKSLSRHGVVVPERLGILGFRIWRVLEA